jgi:hypothetical protein
MRRADKSWRAAAPPASRRLRNVGDGVGIARGGHRQQRTRKERVQEGVQAADVVEEKKCQHRDAARLEIGILGEQMIQVVQHRFRFASGTAAEQNQAGIAGSAEAREEIVGGGSFFARRGQ